MNFLPTAHRILYSITLLLTVVLLGSCASVDTYFPFALLLIGAGISLAALYPTLACALGLFLVPLGGHRPGTAQALHALILGMSLFLGLALNGRKLGPSSLGHMRHTESTNKLLAAALLYSLCAVASLSSVPLTHLFQDIRNALSTETYREVSYGIVSILQTSEHSLLYSSLSTYLTLLAYFIGFGVYRLCEKNPERSSTHLLGAAFMGLLASFVLGILDYYSFIDLTSFRSLDPIVNPGGTQFRLQSTFGHSGWYAEYLTLTIPTCLIVLSRPWSFVLRVAAILLSLAVGEFVLILTYQRGGWLSYPLTLVAVWAAIYVVRLLERQETDISRALRRSALKVVISLPATVLVSLALVWIAQGQRSLDSAISPYVSRFKDIQRTSDRTDFLQAGFLIGTLHPILGGGADSFAWQFEKEFESSTGRFHRRFDLPLHGTAHNVYAQTYAGKGVAGLLALLAIPVIFITTMLYVVRDKKRPPSAKLVALTGGCFGCAFLIYGHVQEIFYVQSLQFLFFSMVGIVAAVGVKSVTPLTPRATKIIPALSTLFLIAHLVWEFGWPGYTAHFYKQQRVAGCFPAEQSADGATFRWCEEQGTLLAPVSAGAVTTTLRVQAGPREQHLSLAIAGGTPLVVSLRAGEAREISLPLPPEAANKGNIEISFRAATSFVPHLMWSSSTDSRRLAYKVSYPGE